MKKTTKTLQPSGCSDRIIQHHQWMLFSMMPSLFPTDLPFCFGDKPLRKLCSIPAREVQFVWDSYVKRWNQGIIQHGSKLMDFGEGKYLAHKHFWENPMISNVNFTFLTLEAFALWQNKSNQLFFCRTRKVKVKNLIVNAWLILTKPREQNIKNTIYKKIKNKIKSHFVLFI